MLNDKREEALLKTLAYFDLFAFPLTADELFSWLWQGRDSDRVAFDLKLAGLVTTGVIGFHFGYYFLPGRDNLVEERRARLLQSEHKLKIARRAARLIRSVPFIRAVYVCNTVGAGAATQKSDIDFFIVAAPGRIWLTRFFTNLILRLFRLRTYGDHKPNRVCLSFYASTDGLNFSSWRLVGDDVYLVYWFTGLVSLFDADGVTEKLWRDNLWLKKYLPNWRPETSNYGVKQSDLGRAWQKFWETMWRGGYGDLMEKQAREAQKMKLKFSLKEKAAAGDAGVIINDRMIKLHERDRREYYASEWRQKCGAID